MQITGSNLNFGTQHSVVIGNQNTIQNVFPAISPQSSTPAAATGPAPAPAHTAPLRFEIHELKTQKTQAHVRLVIRPQGHGDQRIEIPAVVSIPAGKDLAESGWYYTDQKKHPDDDRAGRFEQTIRQHGTTMYQQLRAAATQQDHAAALWAERFKLSAGEVTWTIIGSPGFQRLPWEWLHDPDQGIDLACQYTFSRRLTDGQANSPLQPPHGSPLRVLWVTARKPDDRIARDRVLKPVQDAVRPGVQIDVLQTGDYAALIEKLHRHARDPQWHILHLDLHGALGRPNAIRERALLAPDKWQVLDRPYHGDLPDSHQPTGCLLFENADASRIVPILARELAVKIGSGRIPLVVLNACWSAAVPEGNTDGSLAAELVQYGAWSALGFHQPLTGTGAQRFFTGFYKALAESTSPDRFDQAVLAGRRRLMETRQRGSLYLTDWPLPIWYSARDVVLP